ncbi:MAG: ATPase, partial [Bdellovibrionales bacterium]|nr:ATPase [Bdellovibrionales bacterium]
PDLLPSDLIGTMIYSQKKEEFTTKFGPIFTQLLLADEINRSPAKVQAALLEAMAERQVTIGDETHKLTSPFVVLATQNPIEQEGTYTLPEAQLDRFMMKVFVDYPSLEAEKNILTLESGTFQKIESILTSDDLNKSRKYIESVYVDPKVNDYIVRCVTATRPSSSLFLSKFDGAITAGASPRASLWLNKLSRFNAFINNKELVTPEDVIKYIPFVLGHRVILSYEAQVDNMNSRDITAEIANTLV